VDGFSVVSVNGSRHAIVLVSDLGSAELTELSQLVSLPLVQRLGGVMPNRSTQAAFLTARPVEGLVSAFVQPWNGSAPLKGDFCLTRD
jgi:hypothetical protein